MKQLFAPFILMAAFAITLSDVAAHTRSESYSHWYLSDSGATGVVTIPLREVMVLYENGDASVPAADLFRQHLQKMTYVSAAGEQCTRDASNVLQVASGFIRVELHFSCGNARPDEIRYRAMFNVAPAHVHYAKAHRNNGLVAEALITQSADTWKIGNIDASDSWSFRSFVMLGIEHIAGGVDHIAFLLGILLIAGSPRRSILAVTGFTLGHSLSLAAAVLGFISADSQLVEAFIGFTIMLVAVEYMLSERRYEREIAVAITVFAWVTGIVAIALDTIGVGALRAYAGVGIFAGSYILIASENSGPKKNDRARYLLIVATFCFGLLHGFGFAGFLIDTGLLGNSLLKPLLGFNLGVELGQLAIVAAAITSVAFFRQFIPKIMPQLAAAGLCGVGVFWFVGRTLA